MYSTPPRKRRQSASYYRPAIVKRRATYARRPSLPLTVRSRSSRVEVKDKPTNVWEFANANEAMSANLTDVQIGSAPFERTGKVVQGRQLKWWLKLNSVAQNISNNNVRVTFFRWNDDETPSPSDIFNAPQSVTSSYNTNRQAKWKILYDTMIDLNANTFQPTGGLYAPVSRCLMGTIKTNWQCVYDDDMNHQDTGSIRCFVNSDYDNTVTVNMHTQFFYTDV